MELAMRQGQAKFFVVQLNVFTNEAKFASSRGLCVFAFPLRRPVFDMELSDTIPCLGRFGRSPMLLQVLRFQVSKLLRY